MNAKPRTSFLTLPTEILLQIFSYLGSAHLKQLSLTHLPKYGQYFRNLTVHGRVSQEFIDRLAVLLKILDARCDCLENFSILVPEQTPGVLELNPPCLSQGLSNKHLRALKLTCSATLIAFLTPLYFPSILQASLANKNINSNGNSDNKIDNTNNNLVDDSNVIQSVYSLNHYVEKYGSQITRAHMSFEGLSDVWVAQLLINCPCLQELVLERKYIDDNIEISDSTLDSIASLSNTLKSLSFTTACDSPLTEWFTYAGWRRMLGGTSKLEKLDISGLHLKFIAALLPMIADFYKDHPLWLKHTGPLNNIDLRSRYRNELELMNLIAVCKNNLLGLESSYISDAVIKCLTLYSPGIIRLCMTGDLLNRRKSTLNNIEKKLLNLETFQTWKLSVKNWPIGLCIRFGKRKNEYNCFTDDDD
ncbi:1302_t:CDS:2 [Entrophospora sp. SA101]|nr:1302_t:CDS:2 [Entrophospora sp. SA101]